MLMTQELVTRKLEVNCFLTTQSQQFVKGSHEVMVISNGNGKTAVDVMGGMWSFFSLTTAIMRVIPSSRVSLMKEERWLLSANHPSLCELQHKFRQMVRPPHLHTRYNNCPAASGGLDSSGMAMNYSQQLSKIHLPSRKWVAHRVTLSFAPEKGWSAL